VVVMRLLLLLLEGMVLLLALVLRLLMLIVICWRRHGVDGKWYSFIKVDLVAITRVAGWRLGPGSSALDDKYDGGVCLDRAIALARLHAKCG
jgi:hypothetical protein